MSDLTNPALLLLVVCPGCGGELAESAGCLTCARCGKSYKIRQGIPLLYPPDAHIDHLHEEEDLARMMKRRPIPEEQFSLLQWQKSKQEFWSVVRANIETPPKLFVNIGCGYDASFREFEQQGHTFVNFDVTYDMLSSLRRDFGGRSCVAGDVNCLPFKKGTFDYVVSIDLIHHESGKLLALLESFRDLLKPGGILFLEDPNAWGLFQMAKSILLPKPVYRTLRSTYHRLKGTSHGPADYEFPTSVWKVKDVLRTLGFERIRVYPNIAYPGISEASFRLYRSLGRSDFVRKYHNYHYIISAVRR